MPIVKSFNDNVERLGGSLGGPFARTKEAPSAEERECRARGGRWDPINKTCILPQPEEEKKEQTPPKVTPNTPEVFKSNETGRTSGVTLPDGRTFLGLSPEESQQVVTGEQERAAIPEGSALVGTSQAQANERFASEQLAGQVGQFNELGIDPTGLNAQEALTVGITDSIPSAIRLGAQAGVGAAAIGGITTAGIGGVGAVPAAAIGAGAGFVAGIAGGMISSFKGQRRDTTTAQQRVLDEGKQTMNDWITMTTNDPANKNSYLAEYNKVAAQVDQAYRQMKLDTSRDLAKFETALPNLAEFESFYAEGGERDNLDADMRNALLAQSPPNYDMLELAYRRGKND